MISKYQNCNLKLAESLLENLLSLEATRMSNYPSLEELLENQFFSNAIGSISKDSNGRKQYLKFSASTKESLAKHKSDFESRLLEDHKKVMINNLRYLRIRQAHHGRFQLVDRYNSMPLIAHC